MRTPTTLALALLLPLGACSSTASPEDPPAPTTTAVTNTPATDPPTTTQADPYQTYLALAPADAPELTPDDAQTRAMLGCSTTWAPGTVDAALQQAYAPLIEQWKAQGICPQ